MGRNQECDCNYEKSQKYQRYASFADRFEFPTSFKTIKSHINW